MDKIAVLQYRRGSRRLQIVLLPWSFNVSASVLVRFISVGGPTDPLSHWRLQGIIGMRCTIKIPGLEEDFIGDAMVEEILSSRWFQGKNLILEAKGIVDTSAWDMGDLVGGRVPRDLLTRIGEQVDNWA